MRRFSLQARVLLSALFIQLCFSSLSRATNFRSVPSEAKKELPWYMKQTAMDASGRLTFLDKPWWPRAHELAEGQSFTLDLSGDGKPDTVIERIQGNIIEAIDDTGRAANILNRISTAYLVSYRGTGIVDRMVAYIDNDGDGKCDEMEVRYYRDGYLRFGWFAENFDSDGAQIFDLNNWQYSGNGFASKFTGNVLMYLNKYDPATQSWVPLAECPFAFFDPNHDGLAEIVIRVSAEPKQALEGDDVDYANNPDYRWDPNSPSVNDIVMANLRLSYSLDPEPRHQGPHSTFGFTMVGAAPYQIPGMFYTNPRRRPPQTVVRVPWDKALETALHYPAQETGFSWDEMGTQDRWEGQFWTWERRLLNNTGNPVSRWNMRREYSPHPSDSRQLYYSGVDKRYHLFGATEGWLEVGRVVNDKKDLEIRMYDSNGDGYFDTWEVFRGDNPVPVRTTRVLNQKVKLVLLDRAFLAADYNQRVLPQAIADDQRLLKAMEQFVSSPLAHQYEEEAAVAPSNESKRYLLDVARELDFLKLRDALYARGSSGFYPKREALIYPWDMHQEKVPMRGVFWHSLQSFWHIQTLVRNGYGFLAGYTPGDSSEFWRLADQTEKFVDDYGNGDFDTATEDLGGLDHRVLVSDNGTLVLHWAGVSGTLLLVACLLFFLLSRRGRNGVAKSTR
jgi:hypothetical protein